ncbi:pyridoxamine 5'-phosphate oxidase family protein [Paraburkholderia sp. 22099]|jgi:PPOX class probable FMN-dependent enzyme|uniref:PPOX class probable FMN-dependent enzyme n=1 Tax=Paraburkholderia terricola TaxID=169427 RepID=A0A1M6K2V8_9BURK|nr:MULTISPECIES: pyridoxamine 5'-phosphate oxidase family protein [Paraburkholderia]ORC51607.1 pyridoxamine 5'-phosphate oxidase [Burkholderia sp. A27]AXE95916.1 pyridoxamine 5'-phosphate oxidase family protein [Paraburkholderia terricola]MDR6407057.1 PPOX class probable FMN-dependent enzyme [Paraburkholderia terricola]MDR6445407.1 PPOX class probable FMN-dependent enzyme [Paraburkholderia terricola]MDR6479265.1 PPOX class probable FMN-dependent enzyme [Paraburkholderia terricola]
MLTTIEQLEARYGQPNERSVRKEIAYVNEDYRAFIEVAPFVVLATAGPDGLDCSPRGDTPGFVRIVDERTLALPDRIGNNRIDSLRNIIVNPHLALLFIIPGVGESLRVNGRGRISDDPAMLNSFAVEGKLPRTVLLIDVDAVYFHCSKALVRSKLWDPAHHVERSRLPSAGEILRRVSGANFDAATYDRELAERVRTSLY